MNLAFPVGRDLQVKTKSTYCFAVQVDVASLGGLTAEARSTHGAKGGRQEQSRYQWPGMPPLLVIQEQVVGKPLESSCHSLQTGQGWRDQWTDAEGSLVSGGLL